MTRDAAREARRETLEDLIEALRAIGGRGLTGSAADAFAKANQCVGRFQGIDELEFHRDECERGLRARFPRPAVETIDPGVACGVDGCGEPTRKGFTRCLRHIHAAHPGLEIDPADITDEMVDDAAWRAANEQDLVEAAEAFEVAESSEESLDDLCEALDRAAEGGGAR